MKVKVGAETQALAGGRRWKVQGGRVAGRSAGEHRWSGLGSPVVGLILVMGLVTAAACGAGDGEGAAETPRERCLRLRDHLVDVQLQSVTADRDQHQAAFRAALDLAFVDDCTARMDDRVLDCRLAASDAAGLVACDTASAPGALTEP